MAEIIYSRATSGLSENENAQIGKLATPIKLVIEHESDIQTAKGGPCEWLFNVEASKRFGETIVNQNEFGTFMAAEEGAAAEGVTMKETSKKFIEHIQFMSEFTVTASMMEDANYGVASDIKRLAQNFTRAYYRTRHKLAQQALINGTSSSMTFNKATVDLTTADGCPLFHNSHKYGAESDTQTNSYYTELGANGTLSVASIEAVLGELAVKMRAMKDENGEPLGYTADTIIIPGYNATLEKFVKQACGSVLTTGSGNNEINIQCGNWKVIILPEWDTQSNVMYVMSSEANKELAGNMFFNRIPLTVKNWEDPHTGNYIWNGRCRFGIGFGSYKHIIRWESVAAGSSVQNATSLSLG